MKGVRITVGRRKEATARVRLVPGTGRIWVNGQDYRRYFQRKILELRIERPLVLAGVRDQYDVIAKVEGGGKSGQADAIRLGIARWLVAENPDLRPVLKKEGLLTRDPREKERKKYGLHRARRARQYRKR